MNYKQQNQPSSRVALAAIIALASALAAPTIAMGAHPNSFSLIWDNFRNGFSANGPAAKWFYFSAGSFIGNDGVTSTGEHGLTVVAGGSNALTGFPAFTKTLGQEFSADNPNGVPGGVDHVKWLVYMNHIASSGVPGFDAVEGQKLVFTTWISGRSFGTGGHPFGNAVLDSDDDLRLGASAMNTIDFDSFMVFDFWLTNKRIYAFYERLPFGRDRLGNYAAFSYMIPVRNRAAADEHKLSISYDRSAGIVRWLVDDDVVFLVNRLGHRIDRRFMTIDHGGVEQDVSPQQLDGGMGLFTLLDGFLPSHKALVRLSSTPNLYFDTISGQPTPQVFLDEHSLPANRLFGQGARLEIKAYKVSSGRQDEQ